MMQPLYWDLQRLSCKAPFNAQYRTMAEGIPVPKWFVQRNLGAKAKKKWFRRIFSMVFDLVELWVPIWLRPQSATSVHPQSIPCATSLRFTTLSCRRHYHYARSRSSEEPDAATPLRSERTTCRTRRTSEPTYISAPERPFTRKKQCFVQIRTFKSHPWCCKAP